MSMTCFIRELKTSNFSGTQKKIEGRAAVITIGKSSTGTVVWHERGEKLKEKINRGKVKNGIG